MPAVERPLPRCEPFRAAAAATAVAAAEEEEEVEEEEEEEVDDVAAEVVDLVGRARSSHGDFCCGTVYDWGA